MNPAKKLLTKLNGLHYRQEYLCLAKESFPNSLHIYQVKNDLVINDVTDLHLFVGYCSLILAFSRNNPGIDPDQQNIKLTFSHKSLQPNEKLEKKDAIASLSLRIINKIEVDNDTVLFFEGIRGAHHFISGFHQSVIQLYNRLYNRKTGNVFLNDNLYTQIQIAYAAPRKICLITVGENDLYNHFPTDLHGKITDRYIISLRHEGLACKQVESIKRIVLSDMNVSAYKKVYSLGKNHMQPLKEQSAFDFGANCSDRLQLPLPKELISYKELELESSFTHGIHKLLLFKIINEKEITTVAATLTHIHNSYATWRYKHHISSNFLLR